MNAAEERPDPFRSRSEPQRPNRPKRSPADELPRDAITTGSRTVRAPRRPQSDLPRAGASGGKRARRPPQQVFAGSARGGAFPHPPRVLRRRLASRYADYRSTSSTASRRHARVQVRVRKRGPDTRPPLRQRSGDSLWPVDYDELLPVSPHGRGILNPASPTPTQRPRARRSRNVLAVRAPIGSSSLDILRCVAWLSDRRRRRRPRNRNRRWTSTKLPAQSLHSAPESPSTRRATWASSPLRGLFDERSAPHPGRSPRHWQGPPPQRPARHDVPEAAPPSPSPITFVGISPTLRSTRKLYRILPSGRDPNRPACPMPSALRSGRRLTGYAKSAAQLRVVRTFHPERARTGQAVGEPIGPRGAVRFSYSSATI